jgi:phosphoglycerol transferase MdoB-like AlkP superfamily enzyme
MASKNYADNILFAFNNINKIENIVEPKFVFAHVVCPHPPYLFDENGQNISTDIKLNNVWDNKDYYLNQVKFVNKKTIEFIDGILEKSTDAIIILQSDHGPSFLRKDRDNPSAEFIQERGKILNAILMDKKATNSLYPEISSVNTFRVIFNNVFKDNFELLKDSTFYSSYERPYKFINVTDIIDAH